MKAKTEEWINKAEGDYRTACRELMVTQYPNFDAVCFHAQQCAEKYLKARLVEADIKFKKIHDLDVLLELILPIEPKCVILRDDCLNLINMAVEIRYPGIAADSEDAGEAVESAKRIRDLFRNSFGLEA